MTSRKRNILIILAVIAMALAASASLLFACKGGEKETESKTGVITLVDDSGYFNSQYELEVGSDVFAFMETKVPQKEHALFAYWEYDGQPISSGLLMTEEMTLTAVYNIEITLNFYAENLTGYEEYQDEGSYTYLSELDFTFYDLPGVVYTAGELENLAEDALGQIALKVQNAEGNITVSSDYTKNTVKIYCSRSQITIRFSTNYPADSGMADTTWEQITYYGYPVELGSNYVCAGYLMLGWSSEMYASFPEYAVDCVSDSLMVWDSSSHTYVIQGSSGEVTVFYPTRTTAMYIIWAKGYVDMFGGTDTAFVTSEDADFVYLYRGGYYWKSDIRSGDEYTFTNNADITGSFRIKLSTDYVFTYWEERLVGPWYRYTLSFDSATESLTWQTSDTDYIDFSEYDDVAYVSGGNRSEGKYRIDDEEGVYVLTFSSGPLTGETRKVSLGEDVNNKKIFMFQNEEEADMGRLYMGVSVYDSSYGVYATCYSLDYYYLRLTGFGTCVYYVSGTTYTYTYWLDSSENVLYLYYTAINLTTGEYVFVLAGKFKAVVTDVADTDTGETVTAWFLYYEEYDGTFDVYAKGENGENTKIGEVTLDGYSNAYYVSSDGKVTSRVRFGFSSLVEGTAIYLGGTGAEEGDVSRFLFTRDTSGNYIFELVLSSYQMLYHYSGAGLNLDILTLDYDGVGSAKYSVYGYDWYDNAYYFTVMTGTYEEYYNSDYGFTYYIFTVEENDFGWESYFENYIPIYYSSLEIGVYSEITELAFIVGVAGSYDADMWLWYSTSERTESVDEINEKEIENPWYRDGDVVYIEEYKEVSLEVTLGAESYEITNDGEKNVTNLTDSQEYDITLSADLLIVDGRQIYAAISYCEGGDCGEPQESSRYVTGYVYGTLEVLDESDGASEGDTFTSRMLVIEFYGEDMTESEFTYYYTYVFVKDSEDGIEQVTYIPSYYYVLTLEGDEIEKKESYIKVNWLDSGDEIEAIYYDETTTTTYEGKLALDETLKNNEYGYSIYKFTSTCDNVSFSFVYMTYTSEAGSETVIMIYDENKTIEKKGADESTINIDPLGFEAIYVDASGNEIIATYTDFEVAYDEDGKISNIQIRYGTQLITLDFVESEEGDYTVRGWEMGEYYIVDYLLDKYIVYLDGKGGATLYSLDGENIGSGAYTLTDTVIEIDCTINEEGGGAGTELNISAVVDVERVANVEDTESGYAFICVGNIYVDNTEFTGVFVNSEDMTTIELRTDRSATLTNTDGTKLEGTYTWLDDTYFHFSSYDKTYESMYKLGENNNVTIPSYNTEAKYYTANMGSFFELTRGGELKTGDKTYYYTVGSDAKVTIYYIPEDATAETNKFGYATYTNFGTISDEYTAKDGATTYYRIDGSRALQRAAEDTGYSFLYGSGHYDIGQLTLQSSAATESYIEGLMIYGDVSAGNTRTAYIYIDDGGQNGPQITMCVTTHHTAYYYYYYAYYDYLYYEYEIEVDLSTNTYKITDEKFYLITYLDSYLQNSYYGYSLAAYSYAALVLCWDIDDSGTATTSQASGYILPNMFGEYVEKENEDGEKTSEWTPTIPEFENVKFTTTVENGRTYFYLTLPGSEEGKEYELKFYLSFSSIWNAAYGYNSFIIDKLWSPEEFSVTNEGTTYKVKYGYGLYSDVYSTSSPFVEIFEVESSSDEEGEESIETALNILWVFELGGKIFAMEGTYDEEGKVISKYWEITYTEGSGETGSNLTMSLSESIVSYSTEGAGFVDVYTGDDGNKTIITVYMQSGYSYYFYLVYSSEYDENTGTYTVLLGDGNYYLVGLKEETDDESEETTYTATIEVI
ncbi:MAG: hypothetical protein LUD29_04075 [Clostridia bacterium]|nr:hypothetical protein [Clostridia bacterium]